MSQYPERDNWGAARFARLVRKGDEYWVEWVLSFPEDHLEEAITAVKHAPTPQQALQYAHDTIADFDVQIACGEYYVGDFDESAAQPIDDFSQLSQKYLEDAVHLRFPLHAQGESKYMLIGFVIGTHTDVAPVVKDVAIAGVTELSKQLEGIPDLESQRWMLIW